MPDEQTPTSTPIPEGMVEVKEPVLKQGTTQFLNKAGFNNPTPSKLKLVVKSLQGTFVALMTLVSATTIFDGNQTKVIVFCLGVASIVLEGIAKATGVMSVEEQNK